MARIKDREKAIKLRKQGKSYSQIKTALNVSKSTLHYWLKDYPLSDKKIRELRDWNPQRIENFRNTMRKKKEDRLEQVYEKVAKDVKRLSKRDLFIGGLFLYWAEGTKSSSYTTSVANTDPAVLKFFILWLKLLDVDRKKIKARLHLYKDMSEREEINYWSKTLNIPKASFRKSYIKKTQAGRITHKGTFGHGTCNIIFDNRDTYEYIVSCLKYLRGQSD